MRCPLVTRIRFDQLSYSGTGTSLSDSVIS